MAAPPKLSGPGLLYAHSKISKPDVLSEETYLKWYSEEHIPDVVNSGGVKIAFFYQNVDKTVDRPYLALYPLEDLAFLSSDKFKTIRVQSDLLPGSGLCYDYADIDIRYYKHIQIFDPTGSKVGRGKCMMAASIEPGAATTPEDFDNWYRNEHLAMLTKVAGYLRTTRYELKYARTNAQSRIMKGLATEEEKSAKLPEPPTYLALHEFSTVDLSPEELKATIDTDWSRKILGNVKQLDSATYKLGQIYPPVA